MPAAVSDSIGKGVTLGRKGRGNVYVWPAGDDKGNLNDCNFNNYANDYRFLTVGALDSNGTVHILLRNQKNLIIRTHF